MDWDLGIEGVGILLAMSVAFGGPMVPRSPTTGGLR